MAVKTGVAIFEVDRITAAKAEREKRKPQLPQPPHNANAQPPPTYPGCHWTIRPPIGLVGLLRTNFSTRTTPNVVSPSTSPSTPSTSVDRPPERLPPPSSSSSSYSTAPASAAVASAMSINFTHNPDTTKNTNTTTVKIGYQDPLCTCLHCDCRFTSHIGLAGHLLIHHTETGEPVLGHQPTLTASAFTVHVEVAYLLTAWVY
nr:unnamed protein product [Spirometra erinaceieuropaei]